MQEKLEKLISVLLFGTEEQIDGAWPIPNSVSNVMEFPGAGLGRLRTINSELNDAT